MNLRTAISIGFIALFSSCVMNKPIAYSVTSIQKNTDTKLSGIILDVELFTDKRKDSVLNGVLFVEDKECFVGDTRACINAEKHYKTIPAATQITNMFVKHLKARKSFKGVVMNRRDTADFYVSGNLTKFYGQQEFSTNALVGAQFGLIGAIATAGAKTRGMIIIEMTDVKIYNSKNEVIKDIGIYRKVYEDDFHADAYCWCMYDNINLKLKDYFDELVVEVETSIKQVNQ